VITLTPIGVVRSPLRDRAQAPRQAHEGAPAARLVLNPEFADAWSDLAAGDEIVVLTWLDRADRTVLRVHPRDDSTAPLRGVFSTRSQDRPNPIGVHRVRIVSISGSEIAVDHLEVFDGTPVVDVKPVMNRLDG
jgi:tRNA-Thr(GGU) m(6)t(6)A37 methyltransferase TsaA